MIKQFLYLITVLALVSSVYADVTLIDDEDHYLEASATLQSAIFTQNNSWFGQAKNNIGTQSDSWFNATIEPGLKGHFKLQNDGQLYYELSYLYAKTLGDTSLGETQNYGKGKIEQAHLGWRSGNTFSLAKNLIDVSLGYQDYKLGHGFLLWGGGSAGGKNGAYWIGSRHTFANSGVLKINTGSVKTDLFRLESIPLRGDEKEISGINFEYLINDNYTLGLTYINVKQDDKPSIDGADIFDIRIDIIQPARLPGFSLLAEYVKENNGDALDSSGWYSDIAWQFKMMDWQPQISYRYASLQGDNPDTIKNEAFDPLRYGFADWNTWFQGEIIGDYVLGNSNLNTHMLKIQGTPNRDLKLKLFYFQFFTDQPQSRGISSKHFADEVDFIIDWSITQSFSVSAVVALAKPHDGAKEMTGGDDNWLLGMLYGYYRF